MTDARLHDVCADPVRRLFFERVGRHFVSKPVAPFASPKPCSMCGAMLTHGFEKDGVVSCGAQRSITEKRDPAYDDPARVREPKVRKNGTVAQARGYNSFNDDRRVVIITPSLAFVAANVKPSGALPKDVIFRPSGSDLTLAEAYRMAFSGDIETPALIVAFQRNVGVPFVMTESADSVVVCGTGTPLCVDVKRVRLLLDLGAEVGAEVLHQVAVLRRRIAEAIRVEDARGDQVKYVEHLRAHPALAAARDSLPTVGNDAEYVIVARMLKSAKKSG